MKYNPYSKNLRTRIFDIETTGLYPMHDMIISASFVDTDGSNLVQYFCEAPEAEDYIIANILKELSETDSVVTYNGNRFDLPFVLCRSRKYKIANELPLFYSADIYIWLKYYWAAAARMKSLSQKSVEEALGLSTNRTDEIGGGECIPLYSAYINANHKEAKEKILLHNGDDVRQLARITEKLSFLPYHKIAFEKGFAAAKGMVTSGSKLLKNRIETKAKTKKGSMPADIYTDAYHLEYDSQTGAVKLDLFTKNHQGYEFIDLKEFPFETACFEHFRGYQSGYLILQSKDGFNYAECNAVTCKLLGLL